MSDQDGGAVVVDSDSVALVIATENGVLVFESAALMPVITERLIPVVARAEAPTPVVIGNEMAPQLIVAGFKGDKGDKGDSGGGTGGTYIYEQVSAAAVWDIIHNLKRYPSITTIDSAGTLVDGAAQYVSENELIITFASAMAGQAFLN